MHKCVNKIAKHFKLASLILLLALVGGHTLDAGGRAQTQAGSSTLKAELKSSAEAKRALSDIGTRDFKQVKNARVRQAATRSLAALRAVANNTSKAREATLAANFVRSVKTLKGLAQPGSTPIEECDKGYELCIELCKETGGNCDLCGFSQYGCYLNKLAIEMTKNPDDPTP
ncbi:MAG TPA: hypothetical protein VF703_15790 [Pyrinomonadaceae bacterium]